MSRCFPFPPPGYEKPITYEVDVPKKEKHKEKKHKKDRKDKEKREPKEKREKDRSDGKHREKKDKKKKHREKKKDKGKEKDNKKGKSSASGEKNIDGQAEQINVQKLNQKDQQVKDEFKILVEKKQTQLDHSQCGEKPFRNGHPAEKNGDAKFVQELDRRTRDDEKGSTSLALGRVPIAGVKINGQMDKLSEPMTERKDTTWEKRIDFKNMDGQRIKETSRYFGHQALQSVGATPGGMIRPLENMKIENASMEEKSKSSNGREEVEQLKDKHKDKNREEKIKTNDRDGGKKKKDRKNKYKSRGEDKFVDLNNNHVPSTENMITPPHLTKNGDRSIIFGEGIHKNRKEFEANDVLSTQNIIPPHQKKVDGDKGNATEGNLKKMKDFEPNGFSIARKDFEANDVLSARSIIPSHHKNEDADKDNATEGNLKKRKDFESNGFLNDMDSRPNKVACLNHHLVTDNGTQHCLKMSPNPSIAHKQVSTNNLKVNGVIGHQPVTSSHVKSKPPHPDTKYLKEVLSVPEMERWVGFDDQDWLLNNGKSNTYKGTNRIMFSEGSRVWSQAMEIESADIYALPYVIPY